ncbi:MAG: pyridoxamine 5'-phosphate oxidase family protein [Pseudomonadota bacterium]
MSDDRPAKPSMPPMFHEGMRALQDKFGTRRIADRLAEVRRKDVIDDYARSLIEPARFFLLATADADGWPDCSWKGGDPGFVKVLDERRLAFPSINGNGHYRSLGNILANPKVGMLFVDLEERRRVRVNGAAELTEDPETLSMWHAAEAAVIVTVAHVFPNCPRYIPTYRMVEESPYVPRPNYAPPTPSWKLMDELNDALPDHDPARRS